MKVEVNDDLRTIVGKEGKNIMNNCSVDKGFFTSCRFETSMFYFRKQTCLRLLNDYRVG